MSRFGAHPRFALMPPAWLEGLSVDNKTDTLEVYIHKNRRADTTPFMFGRLLNVFFDKGDIFTNGSVAVQVMSYNKCRLGLNQQSKQVLYENTGQLSTHGFLFKDEYTGVFLNTDSIKRK